MTIKTVTNADTGTADIVGGDDWDAAATLLNAYTSAPDFANYNIYRSGSTYYYRNGTTKTITSNADASLLIQDVLTAINTTGGVISFSGDNFQIDDPLDIATVAVTSVKPIYIFGVPTTQRTTGTVLEATSSFPTNRAIIETSGATDGSDKTAQLYIRGLAFASTQIPTLNVNGIKFDVDSVRVQRALTIKDCFFQYMYKGINLIGGIWWSLFDNIHFSAFNASYIGHSDILLERGTHAGAANVWPKYNMFSNINVLRNPGELPSSLNIQDGSYNTFINYTIDGWKLTDCAWLFQNAHTFSVSSNTMYNPSFIDPQLPSPNNTRAAIVFDGAGVLDNHVYCGSIPRNRTYSVAFVNSPVRNMVEAKGYWGEALAINDAGAGADNTVTVLTGQETSTTPAKPTITGAAGLIKIIDRRKGFAIDGLSATQSGNGSTTVFNIAHGLYAAPLYADAKPYTTDSLGSFTTTSDATNVILTYSVPPPSGTNNLRWYWRADCY